MAAKKTIQASGGISRIPNERQKDRVRTEFQRMARRSEREFREEGNNGVQHGLEVLWDPIQKTVFISPIFKAWPPIVDSAEPTAK